MSELRKKILVVDDESSVRLLVHRILAKEYTVIEAQNGFEAVKIATSEKPDLILMDIMMPGMDGLSACYAIKHEPLTQSIPVIMLTAITHELNKTLSQNVMSASAYITKPFEPAELLSSINKFLSQHKAPFGI